MITYVHHFRNAWDQKHHLWKTHCKKSKINEDESQKIVQKIKYQWRRQSKDQGIVYLYRERTVFTSPVIGTVESEHVEFPSF